MSKLAILGLGIDQNESNLHSRLALSVCKLSG